jgi:hypothetical protein
MIAMVNKSKCKAVFCSASEEKLYLYQKMLNGSGTASEMIRLSYLWGMVDDEAYEDFLKTDAEWPDEENDGE